MHYLAVFALALNGFALGSGYVTGREYVYRYRAHVSSGFPDRKPQYAGIVYDAEVHIQPKEQYSIFHVDYKHYTTFNGETREKEKQPYNYEDLPPRTDFKTPPFKVFFRNGKVTEFQIDKREPVFAINIKRALISLFDLSLEPQTVPVQEREAYKPDYGEHYYKVMEDSLLGQCETQYVVEHLPFYRTPENNLVLNITKTRNYQNCNSVPNPYYSTYHGDECGETQSTKTNIIHGHSFYHYDMRGSRRHYVIEKITMESDLRVTPFPMEGQDAQIFVNRTLELIEERETAEEEYDVSDDVTTSQSMEYDFNHKPKFTDQTDLKQPHYLYHIYGRKATLDQIRDLVDQLLHAYTDETFIGDADTRKKDYPVLFAELVKLVSTQGYDDISILYKEFADFSAEDTSPKNLLTKNLFFDALVNTGTNPALLFATNLIKAGKVPESVVDNFLQQIPYHVKEVTQTLLDEIYDLSEADYVSQRPKLNIACFVSLANIIHGRCVAHYNKLSDEYSCPENVFVTFIEKLAKRFKNSEDKHMRMAYLAALGRLGTKDSLRHLKRYIEDDVQQNSSERTAAIYALGTIARSYPELVRKLIIPLYYNITENYEVRIAAFNMLLKARPELYELESIARNLIKEKDDQVRSYVYSTFRSYDNATHPCYLQLAHDVRYALSILKAYRRDFEKYDSSFSHQHFISGYIVSKGWNSGRGEVAIVMFAASAIRNALAYANGGSGGHNPDHGYGRFTRLSYVASDTGYIPRSLNFEINYFLGGRSFDMSAVGFKQHGLEKIVDKILSPDEFGKKSLFDRFKKRTVRDASNTEEERKEIKEKLHLPTKEHEDVDVEIFFEYMGHRYFIMHFNETAFEGFLNEGFFTIPDLPGMFKQIPPFRYQQFKMPIDVVYLIPSEVGLPVLMDFRYSAFYDHKNNNLKLEVKPAFFKEDRQGQSPSEVHVNIDEHLGLDAPYIATIGVVQPLDHITFGAGINRRCIMSFPIKLDVAIKLEENSVNIQWKPVVPQQFYGYYFEPFTYIDSYSNNRAIVDEQEYKLVRRMGYEQQFTKEFQLAPFGLKLQVDQNFDNEWHDYGSFFSFIVRMSFPDKFFYIATNPQLEPYSYNLTLDNADGEDIKEVNAKLTYSFSRNEVSSHPTFAENGFEEYGQSRTRNMLTSILNCEMVARGHKEHKIQGKITYARDIFRKYHKLHVYYERTTFYRGNEEGHLKACVSGELKYPTLEQEKLAALQISDLNLAVNLKVKAHFGRDCNSDQKIKIHGSFDKTEEQLDLDRHRGEDNVHNIYAYLYLKCRRDQKHGDLLPESCVEYLFQSFKLNKYNFNIQYEHLSPRFINMTRKLNEFFRHELYDHSDTNYIEGAEGEAQVEVNVSTIYPVADIRIRTPTRESHYTHIYVPQYRAFSAYPFYQDIMIKKSLNHVYCKVMGDHVYTFDRYSYILPSIDCWKVIAKDCSPSESFIVLGFKVNHTKYKKAVKIIIGKHKIEMIPVSGDSGIIFRVDGEKISVTSSEPYYHHEKGDLEPLFYLGQKDYDYTFYSEQYGLVVEYDGNFISMEVSPYYRAKLCGLCGNYNGQKYDGYIDKHGCLTAADDAYAYSFAIPSETCSLPKTDKHCH